jgi:hypothetical protein
MIISQGKMRHNKREVKPFRADKPRVCLLDVTNRDGAQSYGTRMGYIERTMINSTR